jgi:hypothetical protein
MTKGTRTAKANYEVGFGKPPKGTQFPKGVSGNPSGGRKKPATMPEVLREGLGKTIQIVENGQRKTITKMEAVVNRLIDKSIVGDMTASRLLLMLAQVLNDSPGNSAAELEELDMKALQSLFETHTPAASG